MGHLNSLTTRLALLVLHAVGAGLASPTVLVTRPVSQPSAEWLPKDNQTMYILGDGERKNLELNTSSISQRLVFITISPCSRDFHWTLYHGAAGSSDAHLSLLKEYIGNEISVFTINVSLHSRYMLQLWSASGGAALVSVRGEPARSVRMRLRVRSRRRLSANWDPSPIDPQSTTYCVVASHRKNYTSLCSAQYDVKAYHVEKPHRVDHLEDRFIQQLGDSTEVDNKIEAEDFNIYEGNYRTVFRRKKIGRSTKATDMDPVIACVGDRTHHLIENLDPSVTYFVSVFGVAKDRRAGSLLATGSVRPRTSTAKRLRENLPTKGDIKGRAVFYFKAMLGAEGGIWMTISTCSGGVDVEVLVRGKRLHLAKNIEPHAKFFVPAPVSASSIQETSDEGSVQFDSSSEEAKMRYVIRVVPCRTGDTAVGVEITASTSRWGVGTPELEDDTVRELRPRRSCRSVDIAFLPAAHNATDVIRYCITARESISRANYPCSPMKSSMKSQCISPLRRPSSKVIVHRINGLKPGRKYAVQVTAYIKRSSASYKVLYADTHTSCKGE